jgi:hypothetical protein
VLFSRETLRTPTEFRLRRLAAIYGEMISTLDFTLGIVLLGLAYSMVMVYNMSGPFIIEHQLQLSPVIAGYCSLLVGLAWMVGGFLSKATIKRPFYKKLLVNMGVQVGFTGLMLVSLGWLVNLYTLVSFAFLIHVCAGYTFNNYFTRSLSRFPQNAGISGGLTGGIVYILVSFLSYVLIEVFPAKDQRNLSYSYFVLALLSAALLFMLATYLRKPKSGAA